MDLVVIDITSGFLVSEDPVEARAGTGEMLETLARRYRLGAFVDSPDSGLTWRTRLDEAGIGTFFESVGTSADFGGPLSSRVLHEFAGATGTEAQHTVVITLRRQVAEDLERSDEIALLGDPLEPPTDIPEKMAWITAIRSDLN